LSNFSPAYILKLKAKFDANEDLTMQKGDIKKFFSCSNHEVDVIMELLDLDGNGSIESYEFMCAMAMLAHGTIDEKAELVFNLYDKDKSGLLEKNEMDLLLR
jgi:Ca2+-binding EF-hand superfamily protein